MPPPPPPGAPVLPHPSPPEPLLQQLVLCISLAPQALAEAALQRAELTPPPRQLVGRLPQALLPLRMQRLQGVQLALAAADFLT